MMFDKILIVCIGNICRSPIAEKILQSYFPNKKITSAGIKALAGRPCDENTCYTAEKHGVEISSHISQQLTRQHCQLSDLILVMEKKHEKLLCELSPESQGKIMLFGHWNDDIDIQDPYGKSIEFYECIYRLITESAEKWANVLNK